MAEPANLSPPGPRIALRLACRMSALHAGDPCGDAAVSCKLPGGSNEDGPGLLLAIVDGLGHGLEAANAAQAAIDLLEHSAALPLADLFLQLEARLASTRGAAVGLARIEGGLLTHAGIGNTRAVHLRGSTATRLPSHNGIVGGGRALRVQTNALSLAPGDWLLLFTDGIDERVHLPLQLPEWRRDPDTLCQHLLERWRDVRDDAGVLAVCVDARAA